MITPTAETSLGNRASTPAGTSSETPAAASPSNATTFIQPDFSLAVIGVLTPLGVVQVVATDRYAKALGYN